MREILFRGKRVDTGEWLYGYFGIDDNKPLIAINKENGINGYFVYPDTVGQYTGLKDKNGNKIFEGDIIKAKLMGIYCVPEIAEVDFQRGAFGLKWYVGDTKKFTRLDTDYLPTLEIIGSVHDNPELLEVK